MPLAPKRICPRCRAVVQGRCPCTAKVDARGPAEQHRRNVAYGRRWKEFRKQYLAEHPLCVDCEGQGRIAAAKEVHHVEKVVDAPERRLDPENVMPLCKACHSARTARGE